MMNTLGSWAFRAAMVLICLSVPLASVEAQASVTPAGFTYTRDLTVGSSGADVSALQQFLIDGGFLAISAPTGYFGPLTRSAVVAWQTSVGVNPSTGYFGPLSRASIGAAVVSNPTDVIRLPNGIATTTSTVAPAVTPQSNIPNGSPMRLVIPSIGVVASFQYTGLGPDGVIAIPTNVYDAGWYTGSAMPGTAGTAIVTGHVAQIRRSVVTKEGVFFNLNKLRAGDNLYVINDKGESTTFIVRELRSYAPTANAADVFAAKPGGRELNLITCEGVWNQADLEFSQRLVVFTDAAP